MLVREVMTPDVEIVRPDSTLQAAAERMRTLDIGPLPVCEADQMVGMITDRDITIRATAEGRDPFTTYVRDVMTPDAVFIYDDQDVAEAARLMEQKQIRRLPVMDRKRKLVGILSLGDLALADIDDELTARTLETISEPGFAMTS